MQRTLLSAAPTDRVGRYPSHDFQLKALPFAAQPFMIAPVLPGETLENLYLESRVVTDPVLNPLIGWKKEYHFFYVKITDLLVDAIRDMFVDETNTDLGATYGILANSTPYYTAKGGIDYLKRCVEKIAKFHYRDEGEAWNAYQTTDGLPLVQIKQRNWMDSMTDKDVMPEGANIATATTAGDLDRLMDAFNSLRAMGMANMTYEDFLRSYGISIPEKDEQAPELLARFQEWVYPANTINPANGAPSSALSWVFKNASRERKFFKEPGFLVGISIARPKVYWSGLAGNMAAHMTRAWDWMPNYLAGMPESQLKKFAGDTGPLGDRLTAPDAYWLDMRDLLLYGDQFQNVSAFPANTADPANVGASNMFALPNGATFNWKNPSEAMVKTLFVDAVNATFVKQDGNVKLSIKGLQVDYTQGNLAQN